MEKEIKLTIALDEQKMPEKITWNASDNQGGDRECEAMMMALWDRQSNNTMRIDLWTKSMKVDEMDHFMFQSLVTMAETYKNSTGNEKLAKMIIDFGKKFAEESDFIQMT